MLMDDVKNQVESHQESTQILSSSDTKTLNLSEHFLDTKDKNSRTIYAVSIQNLPIAAPYQPRLKR